ncbi:MAG: GspE/PulE family protein [bacterium]
MSSKKEEKMDVIKIVNDIFHEAVEMGASDIHFEPRKDSMTVRFRVDGILKMAFEGDLTLFEFVVARMKVLAQLDSTGLPRSQEGNIKFTYSQEHIVDMRVSIMPTSYGECIVVRILERKDAMGNLRELGFTSLQIESIEKILKKSYGLILVTGPNGAGKSTTLFNMLQKLNSPEKSLVTLEDPVERKIDMVRQTNINPKTGLSFANGLKFLLRQDPDVIMVGEIRDMETAKTTVQAAITGHLVLATIHTSTAAGAIVRLINMGVEPFLLSSAIKFISAQRLARINCPKCKEEYFPSKDLLEMLDAPKDVRFYHSIGCDDCNQKGLYGREAVHEVLIIDKEIQNLILTKPSEDQINDIAVKNGMKTLRHIAMERVYDGTISIEEAIRLAA